MSAGHADDLGQVARHDVVSVIVGPDEHGVTRHARALADATGVRIARLVDARGAGAVAATCRDADVCHWHFTDRLFGDDVEAAARRFVAAARPIPSLHVVTLHDVPAGGRSARHARRVAAYRAVAGFADAVIVASEHERGRLRRAGIHADATVIPLPIVPIGRRQPRPIEPGPATVAVLGFVYPGKGHGAVITATAALPDDVTVVGLGRASPGHEDLVDRLGAAAAAAGRRFRLTGFLDDDQMARALAAATVPVVAARAVSASASVGTWLAAGRRPVVVRNGYVAELSGRDPGLVTMCEPDDLARAIRRALDDPDSTWRRDPLPADLTEDAVAAAHAALYERIGR